MWGRMATSEARSEATTWCFGRRYVGEEGHEEMWGRRMEVRSKAVVGCFGHGSRGPREEDVGREKGDEGMWGRRMERMEAMSEAATWCFGSRDVGEEDAGREDGEE